jgi:hypothetical protein
MAAALQHGAGTDLDWVERAEVECDVGEPVDRFGDFKSRPQPRPVRMRRLAALPAAFRRAVELLTVPPRAG